jgi:hypothetical protein
LIDVSTAAGIIGDGGAVVNVVATASLKINK